MNIKNVFFASAILLGSISSPCIAQTYDENSQYESYAPDGVVFRVANKDWAPDGLGNHRAVINVPLCDNSRAIKAVLNWRRPDKKPEIKTVIAVGAESGKRSEHVFMQNCNAESGCIWFEPIEGERTYFLYYMPYRLRTGSWEARAEPEWNDYFPYDADKGLAWYNSLGNAQPTEAQIILYESRNTFEFFSQMGNIATEKEEQAIRDAHPENPILFTEDRSFPIRLTEHLPVRWSKRQPEDQFEGTALRNEYYVWQIGVWAAHGKLENVRLTFSDLKQVNGDGCIKATEMTCFNQEGTNWDGKLLRFDVNVPKGQIQALWCGLQVPENAAPGDYKGEVQMTGDGMSQRTVEVLLHVQEQVLADKGDSDLWRMARLRWLNSRIGENNMPVAPFKAMKLRGKNIQATEKHVQLDGNGMLRSVVVNDKEVLAKPISLEIETPQGTVCFQSGKLNIKKEADGLICWTSEQEQSGIHLLCKAQMEYDGHLNYKLSLTTTSALNVNDIRLNTYYTEYAQEYMMGIGYDGGYRPKSHEWNWTGPCDSYWMGGTKAGLHTEFRGGTYHGPLISDYKPAPPVSWANNGKGRIYVKGENEACVTASTGETRLSSDTLTLEFAIDITPTKPVDPQKQFSMRFFHGYWKNFDKAAQDGANICNIHHATDLNPVINYPFVVQDSLKKFIRHEHEENRKVKLYYTIRELTNHVSEIYALKSLGNEILQQGVGNGAPWLWEHLISGYRAAWYVTLNDNMVDAAFVLSPHSRWINYYLEGFRWMLQNYEIDGLYMDDVSFDRTVMKRMRKIMAEYRPTAIIDLHSNTGYSKGPANQYTDFFPYVDRLWFGESFKYNRMKPDEWLVTFSGIPFGPMSEMLQDGGNRFLGAVYGTTARHSCGVSPVPVWQLWNDFGIQEARMLGYWDEKCPVHTNDPDVKATVYARKDKVMVAIGNFAEEERQVTLDINWKALRMKPSKSTIIAPEIENFQKERAVQSGQSLSIKGKEGLILVISNSNQ